jgi:hypothetical protein
LHRDRTLRSNRKPRRKSLKRLACCASHLYHARAFLPIDFFRAGHRLRWRDAEKKRGPERNPTLHRDDHQSDRRCTSDLSPVLGAGCPYRCAGDCGCCIGACWTPWAASVLPAASTCCIAPCESCVICGLAYRCAGVIWVHLRQMSARPACRQARPQTRREAWHPSVPSGQWIQRRRSPTSHPQAALQWRRSSS